jgi:hypothetical protein
MLPPRTADALRRVAIGAALMISLSEFDLGERMRGRKEGLLDSLGTAREVFDQMFLGNLGRISLILLSIFT